MSQEKIYSNEDSGFNKKTTEQPMTEERMAELSNKYDIKPEKSKEEIENEVNATEANLIEPKIDEREKGTINNPELTQSQIESLLNNLNHFGALLGNSNRMEYLLYKGLISTDQVAEKVQKVINNFIEKGKKDKDSSEIIKADLSDNLDELKSRFANPQYFDEINSKLKINI